jgi:hypothetical protein
MSKVTITCVHCGQSFQIQGAQTDFNEYEKGEQHSPGCGKTTRVRWNRGAIVRTSK